jgi:hypothetical protein
MGEMIGVLFMFSLNCLPRLFQPIKKHPVLIQISTPANPHETGDWVSDLSGECND